MHGRGALVIAAGACGMVALVAIGVVRGRDAPVQHRVELTLAFDAGAIAGAGDDALARGLGRASLFLWTVPGTGSDKQVMRSGQTLVVDITRDGGAEAAFETALARPVTAVELMVVDEDAAVLAVLADPLRYAERPGEAERAAGAVDAADVTVETDEWTTAEMIVHHDVHLSAARRDSIERYVERAAAADPRARIPSDRRLAYEHIRASRTTAEHWRTQLLDPTQRIDASTILLVTGGSDLIDGARVSLMFDDDGKTALDDLETGNMGRRLAFVVDGDVAATAVLDRGMGDAIAQIRITTVGGRAIEETEAVDLAAALRAGVLPAPLRVVGRRPHDRKLSSFASESVPFFGEALVVGLVVAGFFVRRRHSR